MRSINKLGYFLELTKRYFQKFGTEVQEFRDSEQGQVDNENENQS